MMLEKTPPTLKTNPETRNTTPQTARQMIQIVLLQQQDPFDVSEGIVNYVSICSRKYVEPNLYARSVFEQGFWTVNGTLLSVKESGSVSLWIDERPLAVSGLCWWVLETSNLITMVYLVSIMAAMTAGSCQLKARKEALNDLERALHKFPPLLERTFISCKSEEKVSGGKTSEFRVMQWNVLADGSYSTVHV